MYRYLVLLLLPILAACQTTPSAPRFSQAQVATLQQEGFKPAPDGDAWELGIEDRVLFAVDDSTLQPQSVAMIGRLARTLTGIGLGGALIEGHTDATGSAEYNQSLSQRRAEAVRQVMVDAGMPVAGIRTVGLGETDPIESNDTAEGRAQNRRVVVIVAPADLIRR